MEKENLIKRIAQLESLNDQLLAEIRHIDALARDLGFCEGLETLKSAAQELIEEEREKDRDPSSFTEEEEERYQ